MHTGKAAVIEAALVKWIANASSRNAPQIETFSDPQPAVRHTCRPVPRLLSCRYRVCEQGARAKGRRSSACT